MNLSQAVAENEKAETILRNGSEGHLVVASRLWDELDIHSSETAVRRWRKTNGVELSKAPVQATDTPSDINTGEQVAEMDTAEIIADLKAANRRLYQQAAKSRAKGNEMIEAVYAAAHDAAEVYPPIQKTTVRADTRKKDEEVAIWHVTDWQGGKKTVSYDLDVMDERVEQFVQKATILTDVMRADHPVKHCVIIVSGDMIEGVNIFPGQPWELDATLFDQVFRVASRLEWVIREALKVYETVEVICEWGNHGRIGKKSDGLKASDNNDRIVYQIVKDRLAGEDRITNYQVSGDWYQHFTVGNYSAIVIHGDEIKGFGGNIPAYGILRKVNSWASGVVPSFVDCYIGHYHQRMQLTLAAGGSVYMTGSTESDSEYAREFVAATGVPSQRVNFVDPRRGRVTYESAIWLA